MYSSRCNRKTAASRGSGILAWLLQLPRKQVMTIIEMITTLIVGGDSGDLDEKSIFSHFLPDLTSQNLWERKFKQQKGVGKLEVAEKFHNESES